MAKRSEKITLKETWRIHWRAYRDVRSFCPGVFAVTALCSAVKAISPYVAIWLSARIIDELAGSRSMEALRHWVMIALVSAAGLTLLTGVLEHWKAFLRGKYSRGEYGMLARKMLSMDFADVDKTETFDLLSQIYQNENWSGWGIRQLYEQFEKLCRGLFGVLGAAALTVTLFTRSVPASAGALTILNHPAFLALLGGSTGAGNLRRARVRKQGLRD